MLKTILLVFILFISLLNLSTFFLLKPPNITIHKLMGQYNYIVIMQRSRIKYSIYISNIAKQQTS